MVTGSNKGIGFGILETLLTQQNSGQPSLIMTTRDMDRGKAALKSLRDITKRSDIDVEVMQLDLTKQESISRIIKDLERVGPLEVLVNNAGIYPRDNVTEELIETVMDTNYYGPRSMTEQLLDRNLIAPGGKIIFVSSILGRFNSLKPCHPEVYNILRDYEDRNFTMKDFDAIVQRYRREIKDKKLREKWQKHPYYTSKNFLSLYAFKLSREKRILERGIQVYSLDPGYVQTDMTKGVQAAKLTYLQGAKSPCHLIGLPKHIDPDLQGKFFIENLPASL